jgi:diguanylate cyclase (GGDEF)-like protein/PAS domain S-box-containing protein
LDPDGEPQQSRLDSIDEAAIEVDDDGRITASNEAARALLGGERRILIVHDPVERRAELARSTRIASQLADAERIARIGIWEWDVPTGAVIWSDEIFRLFGHKPGSFEPTFERWLEGIHPDDRDRVQALVQAGYAERRPYEFEHRVLHPDGSIGHLLCRGDVSVDDAGEAVRVVGASQEITERVAQQEALGRLSRQREAILDAAGEGICGLDPDGAITFANPAAATMLGRTIGALGGADLGEFIRSADGGPEPFADALERGRIVQDRRATFIRPDGSLLGVDLLCTPIRQGTEVSGAVVTFNDATERRRFEDQLAHLAHHDPLTGLFNRRRFEQELNLQIAYSSRYSAALSVLLIDLDQFKTINDSHGHRAGDEVICSAATTLRGRLRVNDLVARLGGDEFAVLLPATGNAEAAYVAEQLRSAISSERHGESSSLAVTASIGVATSEHGESTADDLLAHADIAMYEAKDAGRDRVSRFDVDRRAGTGPIVQS